MVEKEYEVMRIPSLVESGYEVVDTATMSLTQRMIACLSNDSMADLHLVGEDDIKVNACKFILGSASPNLQAMLYQGDSHESVIQVPNCRAKTLRALVEFSCSDMLNTAIWADTQPVEIVEDMIALSKLGDQYALPNLKQQVSDVLSPCLEQLPSLACVAYNLVDTKTTPDIHAAAMEVLRKKPYQAFVKGPGGEIGGICVLSPDKLDTIFRDQEVNAEEIFLFTCLQEWKAANADLYANADQICRMVAQNLDFSAMNASDIENIVLPSGVVDSGSLVSGLMTVAKAAEKKGISLLSSRRKTKGGKAIDSASSIGSGGSRRARRFKKPENKEELDTKPEEQREEAAPTSVPVVPAPQLEVAPPVRKTRSGKPNSFKRFLGGFARLGRHEEEVETPVQKVPQHPSRLSILEHKVAGMEAKEVVSDE